MYRIPPDLDISPIVGESATQICVGPFDFQFTFGVVSFKIESEIELVRGGQVVGKWDGGRWPDPAFYDILNANVAKYEIISNREVVISLENGIEIHLRDDADQYECIHITRNDTADQWII